LPVYCEAFLPDEQNAYGIKRKVTDCYFRKGNPSKKIANFNGFFLILKGVQGKY